ncbi:MAG: hypothetical protein ACP5JJ_02950 [Anaerolineae bacterium]
MSRIDLSICPICSAQDSLSYQTMEVRGRSHEWYECAECGSALLWLGDDQWVYQKVGREDKAHLLKKPMSEKELLALLPKPEEPAPAPQAGDETLELDEGALASLFSRDWPEYDDDPFAFLFSSASEEDSTMAGLAAEGQPEQEDTEPAPPTPGEPELVSEADKDRAEQELGPPASLFSDEWQEEEEAESIPLAEEEAPGEEEQEPPPMFSRAWFELEATETSPDMAEETAELEEAAPRPEISDDWLGQAEASTLIADEEQQELEDVPLTPGARGEWQEEVQDASTVTVRRDLPEEPRERSAIGRLIPWLLALCLLAFLFLLTVAVYQIVTGSSLF